MKFKVEAVCRSCNGTGLYVGMGERHGAAVVCNTCRGSGCEKIVVEYEPFVARSDHGDVRRVFRCNPGIVIGEKQGVFSLDDFGGMPYVQWREGKPFPAGSEDRKHTCPAWWYQSADYELKPNWDECGFGAFRDCTHFGAKAECWARFDREQAGKAVAS